MKYEQRTFLNNALKKGENEAENLSQMNARKVRVDNLSNCSLQVQWTLMKTNIKECRINS